MIDANREAPSAGTPLLQVRAVRKSYRSGGGMPAPLGDGCHGFRRTGPMRLHGEATRRCLVRRRRQDG